MEEMLGSPDKLGHAWTSCYYKKLCRLLSGAGAQERLTQRGYFWKHGSHRLLSIPCVWKRMWDNVVPNDNYFSMGECVDE